MIVTIAGEKGGPGKTTLTINVAVELARLGRDVLIVDADKTRNATRWAADRQEAGHEPRVALVEKRGKLNYALQDLAERYDIVLVDAPGHDSEEARTAMGVADLLLIVMRPSQFDLDTAATTSEVIRKAKDFNPGLISRTVLTQVVAQVGNKEREEAVGYLEDFPELEPLPTAIHTRVVYRSTVSEGLSVIESSNSKAKAEISVITSEILDLLKETDS